MDINEFDYTLPEELIAQYPLPDRDHSRLLWRDTVDKSLQEGHFTDVMDLLKPGDLLVANNSRVVAARVEATKHTGGGVEILLERIQSPTRILAQLRSNRPVTIGQVLDVGDRTLTVEGREDRFHVLTASGPESVESLFQQFGAVPLPPYIRRAPSALDGERYQTVYATRPGAVAAPTAGLHFTEGVLQELELRGIGWTTVTLHVGAGTFLPVRDDDLDAHRMHKELFEVSEETCSRIKETKRAGGRVVAIGTTTVRALETAASDGNLHPFNGDTGLYIRPGFRFSVVDMLLTNFHLPKSTLLVLVSTFAGHRSVMEMYRYAVQQRFRFFSYGDAMLLERTGTGQ